MRVFVPPIKCQGIKTKIVPWVLANIDYNPDGRWVEPFMGSGVVGFNVRPKRAIFSDINPHIVNFYNGIKSSSITPEIIREYLKGEGETLREKGESHYYEIRQRFNKDKNPLDFLFLSRAGFNGMIRFNDKGEFNVPFCKKPERFSKAYITKIVNQVKYVRDAILTNDWHFECRDFRGVISEAQIEDFIYCDPPYIGRHTDYFNSWSGDDEYALFINLKTTKSKFILSTWHSNQYRVNPYIEKYWEPFNIIKIRHFYHVGAKEKNRNPITEALVLNYEPLLSNIEKQEHKQLVLLESKSPYDAKPS